MKALKIIVILVAATVVLIAGAIAYFASQFDATRVKTELVKAVQEKKQRTLKIDGDVQLAFWPDVAVKVGKISLSEYKSDKEFAALESARISVAVMPLLKKQIVVDTVEVTGAKVTLIKKKDGSLNIADLTSGDKSAGQSDAQPVQIDIAAVKIADVRLTWRDEQAGSTVEISGLNLSTGRVRADTGKRTFEIEALSLVVQGKTASKGASDTFAVRLDAPKISVTPEKSGGESVKLTMTLAGAQRNVNVKLALSGLEGSANAVRIARLALDLDAKMGEASVKGTFESALAADLGKQTAALEKLSGSVEIAHPQMPMKQVKLPLRGALHADIAKQSANGNLDTQFDESKIALKFNVAKLAPLALGFDLDIDKLNVDKYLPPTKAEEKKSGGDEKLDFSALKGLNLSGSVKIGSLQVANVRTSNINLQMKVAGGKAEVAPISANLYEGALKGSLSVDANTNAVAVKQNLAGVSINPLMKDAVNKDMLEGRGNVVLDVTARGVTVTAMKKALNGSASLVLKDGALKGINLGQSLRDLKGKFSSKQDAAQSAKAGDKTDFSEMSASFKIANGVAHNDDLSAKSPFLRLGGAGDIDIGGGSMNYLAKASVVASSGGQGAKDLEYLKGLTVPVRLTGPFENLSYKIEFGSLIGEATKAKIVDAVKETGQKAQEQVKDKLKGLFGK